MRCSFLDPHTTERHRQGQRQEYCGGRGSRNEELRDSLMPTVHEAKATYLGKWPHDSHESFVTRVETETPSPLPMASTVVLTQWERLWLRI